MHALCGTTRRERATRDHSQGRQHTANVGRSIDCTVLPAQTAFGHRQLLDPAQSARCRWPDTTSAPLFDCVPLTDPTALAPLGHSTDPAPAETECPLPTDMPLQRRLEFHKTCFRFRTVRPFELMELRQ
jgi:hypothetical protein